MAQQMIFEVQVPRDGTTVTLRLVLPSKSVGMPPWLVERLETDGSTQQWVPDGDQWLAGILLVALRHQLGSYASGTVRLGQFKYDATRAIPGVRDGFVFEPAPPPAPLDVEQVFTTFGKMFGEVFEPKIEINDLQEG